MKRLLGLSVAAVVLVGLSTSHWLLSAPPEGNKQLVCHVDQETGTAAIIEISVNAVDKHLENHGDCLIGSTDRSLIGQECDATDADGDDQCDTQP